MDQQQNIIRTALNAAQKPFFETINGLPILFKPGSDGAWEHEEFPELREAPPRKEGCVTLHQLDSLLAFVAEHKQTGTQITVAANYAANLVKFKAVIDGHTGAAAGFNNFYALYQPVNTVDWSNWLGKNGQKLGQEDFARFLQDNIASIAATNPADPQHQYPTAAALLEFSSNLEMTSTVKFRSGTKVQNGQVQFEYVEQGDDATKGKLEMFERFGIGVQPFAGGDAYFIEAFLRFRIDRNSGELKLWYDLHRPDKALENATEQMIARVKAEAEVPVYFGAV